MRCRADGGRGAPPAGRRDAGGEAPGRTRRTTGTSLTPTPSGTRAPPSVTHWRPTVADRTPHRSARRTAKPGSAPNARSPSTSKRARPRQRAPQPRRVRTRPRRRRPRHRPRRRPVGHRDQGTGGRSPSPGRWRRGPLRPPGKRRTGPLWVLIVRRPGCADVGRWWAYLPPSDLWAAITGLMALSPTPLSAPMVPISPASPCGLGWRSSHPTRRRRHDPHHARHHRRHRPLPPRRLPLAGRRPWWHHLRLVRPSPKHAPQPARPVVTVLGRLEVPRGGGGQPAAALGTDAMSDSTSVPGGSSADGQEIIFSTSRVPTSARTRKATNGLSSGSTAPRELSRRPSTVTTASPATVRYRQKGTEPRR